MAENREVREEGRLTSTHEMHDDSEERRIGSRVPPGLLPSTISRISWGAIFAGTAVALVAQILFSLLGLAIGLTIIEPLAGQTPWEGIGIGAGIWWVVTALISLFLGGWTAGRLSGMPLRQDAIIHGIVVWALVTFITLYLAISGTGTVIGGAFNAIQQGTQLIGGVGQQLPVGQIQSEVADIIEAAGPAQGAPEIPTEVTIQDVTAALEQLLLEGGDADRQTIINILTERTELTQEEASNVVASFEQRYQQAGQTFQQITQDVTNALAMSAWWGFFAMLIGGIAAAAGAMLAAPRDLPATPHMRRE